VQAPRGYGLNATAVLLGTKRSPGEKLFHVFCRGNKDRDTRRSLPATGRRSAGDAGAIFRRARAESRPNQPMHSSHSIDFQLAWSSNFPLGRRRAAGGGEKAGDAAAGTQQRGDKSPLLVFVRNAANVIFLPPGLIPVSCVRFAVPGRFSASARRGRGTRVRVLPLRAIA